MKMRRKFLGMAIPLILWPFLIYPVWAQNLSEIYVSKSGNILGTIFYFNPGFPSYAFVNGGGLLVWVNMEIPTAFIEIYKNGYIRLVELTPPGSISYANGQIGKIGALSFKYESGRIRKIGDLGFYYYIWEITKIGDVPIVIEDGFIRDLGVVHFEYENARIRKIDDLLFTYESGRIQRIGEVHFDYDWGTLRKVTGSIPGVSVKITSVIEFRRSLRKRE